VPNHCLRIAVALAVAIVCGATLIAGPAAASGRRAELAVIASPTHESGRKLLVLGAHGQLLPSFGGETSRVASYGSGQLAWNPDGRELAFIDPAIDLPRIMLVGADGSNLRQVGESREILSAPVFDPQGDVVFSEYKSFYPGPAPFYGKPPTGSVLRSVPTDGSESRELATFGPGVFVQPYSFAPDGIMAVTVSGPRGSGIGTLRLGGATVHWIVAPTPGMSFSPAVSPDGAEIVFLRNKTTKGPHHEPRVVSTKLISMPFSGGRPDVLATIPGGALRPSWDPSGSRIAFTASDIARGPRTHTALMEINADGSCLTTVYSPTGGSVSSAAWRPGPGRGAGPISC
jgi:Tol biopolymer transport system component